MMKKWPIVLGLLVVLAALAIYEISERLGPTFRDRAVEILRERYQSEVELKKLDLSLFPRIHATGEGLALRLHGRTDLPPLISIQKFTLETGLSDVLSGPRRVHNLHLEGLKITVKRGGSQPKDATAQKRTVPKFVIDEVIADGAVLEIIPGREGKEPLVFDLRKLTLRSAGVGQPMTYRTTMTNAKPPGLIEAHGSFGPWQADEPIDTPVSGGYTFRNADLSVLRGISGILSSDGNFQGQLGHIETRGVTDTPDFRLSISGHPVDLKTDFHSIVDGGDGDTLLQPVKARFLNTPILAKGGVTGKKGVPGKTVALDLVIANGRLEDLLRLALKSPRPFMTGRLNFRTKLLLPPGDQEVVENLKLNGQFDVSDAKFTPEVQGKLDSFSRRAEGHPRDIDGGDIVSNLKGRFTLNRSVMNFSQLSFGVPGALIQLTGTYGLSDETIDLHGTARMDAKLSQMTTGFKSVLLKAVDPFFKKNGAGAVLPIKITGTREHPSFGLELRRKAK
jgi:hypothetical protein